MTEDAKTKPETKGKKGKGEKPAGKGGNLLVTLLLVLMGLMLLGVVGLGVYIYFFPDTYPKPFYISNGPVTTDSQTPAADAAGTQVQPGAAGRSTPQAMLPAALPLPGEGVMFDTGTKIVNLADTGGRRYLKVGITLEFAPHDAAFYTLVGEPRTTAVTAFTEELTAKKPIIDDLLNTMLASKLYDDIFTVDGKEHLRQDIITNANSLLPSERLMYVYFTEFVIQ
jgi:flagellar FliL protein